MSTRRPSTSFGAPEREPAPRLGHLGRTRPVSRAWGGDRGVPIDRHYMESFLFDNSADVAGRVLEIGDNKYTVRFGGDRVRQSEILDAAPVNPKATYPGADLADAPEVPSGAYDCVICTQTLQLLADLDAAVATLHRVLAPGGVALVTLPGISKLYRDEHERWHDYWRFTTETARELFAGVFGPEAVSVRAYGNLLASVCFLHGLASRELRRDELDHADPSYEMLVTVRAAKGPARR